VTPIRRRDLLVVAVGLAIATWLLVRTYYGDLPPLHWYLPIPLGIIAVAEALGARTLRARLTAERDARSGRERPSSPGSTAQVRPVEPLLVARVAVLAQASAWVGAGFAGIWAGVLAYVAPELGRLQSAAGDTLTAVLGLVFAAGLVVAALWLESVCRVPPGGEDDAPEADARA
jgi:uncharacterized protein DUF3180